MVASGELTDFSARSVSTFGEVVLIRSLFDGSANLEV